MTRVWICVFSSTAHKTAHELGSYTNKNLPARSHETFLHLVTKLNVVFQVEATPTSTPWGMDGARIGNNFLLGSYLMANQISSPSSCFCSIAYLFLPWLGSLPRTCNFYERTSGFWELWLRTIPIIVRAQLVSTKHCYWHIIKEPSVPVLWIKELLVPGLSINNSESEKPMVLVLWKKLGLKNH